MQRRSYWSALAAAAVLAGAVAGPALADRYANGTITSLDGPDNTIVLTENGGSTVNYIRLGEKTVIQREVLGTMNDIHVGSPIRVVVPERQIVHGATTVTAKRLRILDEALPASNNPDAGYHEDYVEGIIYSLSPSIVVRTPANIMITVMVADNLQVIVPEAGTVSDLLEGSFVDAWVRNGRNGTPPVAQKVWVFNFKFN